MASPADGNLDSAFLALASSALADRDGVLRDLSRYLAAAWTSFDRPRPSEPEADAQLLERLSVGLPNQPSDPQVALGDAVHVLEASVSPSRPLYLAYVGWAPAPSRPAPQAAATTPDLPRAA